MKDIGHGITVRRAMLRMSQVKLARAIGVNQSYISMVENGDRPLSDEMLHKIANVLRCDPQDFTQWQNTA